MESIYFGSNIIWGKGAGVGPWVMADLEDGLFSGSERVNTGNTPLTYDFIVAEVKGGENGFAIKASDATQGKLQLMYDGPRPPGYQVRAPPAPPLKRFPCSRPFSTPLLPSRSRCGSRARLYWALAETIRALPLALSSKGLSPRATRLTPPTTQCRPT